MALVILRAAPWSLYQSTDRRPSKKPKHKAPFDILSKTRMSVFITSIGPHPNKDFKPVVKPPTLGN